MTIWNMEITASESPQTVHIPIEGKYYAIKNTGDHDILVSSFVANPTDGADDVMKIYSGSAAVIPVKDGDLYVSAEEDGTYSVSIQDDKVIPWGGGTGSGGGSGDTTHYKGTTTTPLENGSTTNPIVIDGENYTAIFGDVVVYGYTEFVFDGTAWSEFGRPFDTVPKKGSTNAVTSDGVASLIRWTDMYKTSISLGSARVDNSNHALGFGEGTHIFGHNAVGLGYHISASKNSMFGCGRYNANSNNSLFEIGNGTNNNARSNIVEVDATSMNVNGDIQINNVAIPIPYATMPTITESMLGKIAMYVGATGNGYTQGCFYVAATDGAAEPTYSWVRIGGRRTETVLWENDGTTNPDTITLSEAWSDFDELVIATIASGGVAAQYETTKHTSAMAIGGIYTLWYNSDSTWGTYSATSSTVFTKASDSGDYHIAKIIGIKYGSGRGVGQ